MELTKQLLIHAIIGKGFRNDYRDAPFMAKQGWAYFDGNQHNESWAWKESALDGMSISDLKAIYNRF